MESFNKEMYLNYLMPDLSVLDIAEKKFVDNGILTIKGSDAIIDFEKATQISGITIKTVKDSGEDRNVEVVDSNKLFSLYASDGDKANGFSDRCLIRVYRTDGFTQTGESYTFHADQSAGVFQIIDNDYICLNGTATVNGQICLKVVF